MIGQKISRNIRFDCGGGQVVGLPVSVGERDQVDVHSLMKKAKGTVTSPSPISELSLRGVHCTAIQARSTPCTEKTNAAALL